MSATMSPTTLNIATVNETGSISAALVKASPAGAAGAPSYVSLSWQHIYGAAGVVGGYAPLNSGFTIPLTYVPTIPISQGGTGATTQAGALANLGLTEALVLAGNWNASTNTPTFTSGSGVPGQMYIVNVAGTTNLDGINSWAVGDKAVFNGGRNGWTKLDGVATEVYSVCGYTGIVVLHFTDILGTATVAQGGTGGTTGAAALANLGGVAISSLGTANSAALLNSSGYLPFAQLPPTLAEAQFFAGTWNASTNSPTLSSGTGTAGATYTVSTSGTTTLDGISQWNVGDKAVFNGLTSTWNKVDGLGVEVLSVNGQVGAVTLVASNIANAADVTANNTFQKTVSGTMLSVAFSTSQTLDLTTSNDKDIAQATANFVMNNPSAVTAGSSGVIYILQDSTGGRLCTSWGSSWRFGADGVPVLSAAGGSMDAVFWHARTSTQIIASVLNGIQ